MKRPLTSEKCLKVLGLFLVSRIVFSMMFDFFCYTIILQTLMTSFETARTHQSPPASAALQPAPIDPLVNAPANVLVWYEFRGRVRGVEIQSNRSVAFAIKEICLNNGITTCADYVLRDGLRKLNDGELVSTLTDTSESEPLYLINDKKGMFYLNCNIFFSTNLQPDFLGRFLERFFGAEYQRRPSLLKSQSSSGTLIENSISPAQPSKSSISLKSRKQEKSLIISSDSSKEQRLKKE